MRSIAAREASLNKGSLRWSRPLSSCEQRLAGEPRKRLFGYPCIFQLAPIRGAKILVVRENGGSFTFWKNHSERICMSWARSLSRFSRLSSDGGCQCYPRYSQLSAAGRGARRGSSGASERGCASPAKHCQAAVERGSGACFEFHTGEGPSNVIVPVNRPRSPALC